MSNDPDQIRREIERTRGELSYDVTALGEKVKPAASPADNAIAFAATPCRCGNR